MRVNYSIKRAIWGALIFSLLLGFSTGAAKEASYKKVLKRWTQSDDVYQGDNLKAAIIWSATLVTDQVLKAQADEYARIYEVNQEERDKVLAKRKEKKNNQILVFVSFFSDAGRFNDMANEEAGWDLRLETGGISFKPVMLEKVNKASPLHQVFYPYLDQWSTGYYVWFPMEAGRFNFPWTLSIHGPNASSKLVFKNRR